MVHGGGYYSGNGGAGGVLLAGRIHLNQDPTPFTVGEGGGGGPNSTDSSISNAETLHLQV